MNNKFYSISVVGRESDIEILKHVAFKMGLLPISEPVENTDITLIWEYFKGDIVSWVKELKVPDNVLSIFISELTDAISKKDLHDLFSVVVTYNGLGWTDEECEKWVIDRFKGL
jgi:hypothetical protein